jgi:hypothetical protein
MYRCSLCKNVSRPKEQLKRYIQYRTNGQINREFPVCHACDRQLNTGTPVSVLIARVSQPAAQPTPEEKPLPIKPVLTQILSFEEKARRGIKYLLEKTPIGHYGKIVVVPKEFIAGKWQGGQMLSFKRTSKDKYKFGALPTKSLEEAVEFAAGHMMVTAGN